MSKVNPDQDIIDEFKDPNLLPSRLSEPMSHHLNKVKENFTEMFKHAFLSEEEVYNTYKDNEKLRGYAKFLLQKDEEMDGDHHAKK